MVTAAQKKATQKYNKANYERIEIVVKKGKKEDLKQYAKKQNKSLNSFIIECINSQCNILKDGE